MQEEVENRTLTLVVSGTKFTGRLLKAAISKYMAHRKAKKLEKQRSRDAPVIPHGKQTVKQLVGQNQGVSNIEITDPSIKDFERIARKYVEQVGELLDEHLYVIENIDATIIAQRPKMRPHIDAMRENIARTLAIDVDQVNIKATTEEGLGFTGSGEGISAQAVCCIEKATNFSYDVTWQEGGCRGCPGCHGVSDDRVME